MEYTVVTIPLVREDSDRLIISSVFFSRYDYYRLFSIPGRLNYTARGNKLVPANMDPSLKKGRVGISSDVAKYWKISTGDLVFLTETSSGIAEVSNWQRLSLRCQLPDFSFESMKKCLTPLLQGKILRRGQQVTAQINGQLYRLDIQGDPETSTLLGLVGEDTIISIRSK